jgi:hypothetical protein
VMGFSYLLLLLLLPLLFVIRVGICAPTSS